MEHRVGYYNKSGQLDLLYQNQRFWIPDRYDKPTQQKYVVGDKAKKF